jgi:predicted amidohydrolase YtcJ
MNATLITNGSVIDGTGAAPRAESVLIIGEKIAAVGAAAEAQAVQTPGVQTMDVAGCTVMPGLIDGHCHISFDEPNSNDELFFHRRHGLAAITAARNARRVLQSGVTGIMDADSIFEIGVDLRDAIEARHHGRRRELVLLDDVLHALATEAARPGGADDADLVRPDAHANAERARRVGERDHLPRERLLDLRVGQRRVGVRL